MPARIVVRTLGVVAIDIGDRRIGPSAGRLFALLLYLASRRGHPTSRRVVQELLFPEATDGQGSHNLRQLLYRLRQIGAPIESDADQLSVPADRLSVDWWDIVQSEIVDSSDLERLSHGLFPGYEPHISEQYREWFEADRAEISLRLRRALTLALTKIRYSGRWDLLDAASRALLALDPLSEEGTLARAEALAGSGSKSAALVTIDRYLNDIGENQPDLRIAPTALRRRISERLPESNQRPSDERVFIGRENVMRTLSTMGAAARAGQQQVLVVWGEPGIGKSRLLGEYRALASLQGGITELLTCQPHDAFRPLGVVCEMTRRLLQAPGSLGCDPNARELLGRLARATTQIGSNREQETAEAPLSAIVRCIDDLMSSIAAEAPILILIDDAQWLDEISLRIFQGVFGNRSNRRSWVIMASRNRAIMAGIGSQSDAVAALRLNPLEYQASLELTRKLLRSIDRSDLIPIEQHILTQARGNPLFIRMLCNHYIGNNDPSALPNTIAELLERRLEQLSVDAVRTLEACAVLASNCTYARLEQLLEVPRHRLLKAIEELDDRGLIEIQQGPSPISHALLSEVVLKRMSRSVCRALHSATALLLEHECAKGDTGSAQWDCAEHWRLAGNHLQAALALRACAQRSLEIGRPGDALVILQRALDLHLPDETRLDLVEMALSIPWLALDWRNANQLIPELKRLRSRLGRRTNAHDEFEVAECAAAFHLDGDPRVHIPVLRLCVEAGEATPRHRLLAARQLLMISELTIDSELARFAYCSTRGHAPGTPQQLLCDLLYDTCFGDAHKSLSVARELVAHGFDQLPNGLVLILNGGYALYRIGTPNDAEKVLRDAITIAQERSILSAEMHGALFLARLYWSTERYDESKEWLYRFRQIRLANPDPAVVGDANVLEANLAIVERQFDRAKECIECARNCRQSQLDLPRLLIAACDVRLRSAKGEEYITDAELATLISLHKRARGIGCQDEAMLAVLNALRWRERRAESAQLLADYLNYYRRDGYPLPTELAQLAITLLPPNLASKNSQITPFRESVTRK